MPTWAERGRGLGRAAAAPAPPEGRLDFTLGVRCKCPSGHLAPSLRAWRLQGGLRSCVGHGASKYAPARRPPRSGIAKVTLDLYRLHPKDFLGCLNVKATLYELYSVSYDIHCTGLKAMLRSLLRLLSYAAQVTGQFLVYAGSYALRLLDDTAPPSPKSQVGSWLGFLHR
ncbi:cell death activator CIDE-A isoform X2 [Fukomys damarensis]|uniref:cell death activator CIDE-A isoform X2 n=1 Tax=Fukomys damarensis TaxID=885580 RepID=UPI0008FF198B|nr:cell death activator CIDE-A isoform X2 [Fukomys damarensis]